MAYDPDIHNRRSIRLRGFDYSAPGSYFVTICTRGRVRLFEHPKPREIVAETWQSLTRHFGGIYLDCFAILPDHIHGIIGLDGQPNLRGTGRVSGYPTTRRSVQINQAPVDLARVVRLFKTLSSRRINGLSGRHGRAVWQRNYFEHIVRTDHALERLRAYVIANPAQWEAQHERHPEAASDDEFWEIVFAERRLLLAP